MKKQSHNKKRIILGITGGFGSGKSTVAKMFKAKDTEIIDADRIAHQLIRPVSWTYKKIVDIFGQNILKKNKTIDRYKLAGIVFNNKKALKQLNKIIHPPIIRIIKNKIRKARSKLIVLDAPLLIEAGLANLVDKLIVVKASRKKQIERIFRKTHLKKIDILKRIRCQIPLEKKVRWADFVIDNSKILKETQKQIQQIRRRLWKN